jgi:hypothetical protein
MRSEMDGSVLASSQTAGSNGLGEKPFVFGTECGRAYPKREPSVTFSH